MCGRFGQVFDDDALGEEFGAEFGFDQPPRYNIVPSESAWVLRISPITGKRDWALLKWGLIPHWAKDQSIGNETINARSETVSKKPAFRDALKHRRALILAIGFYEWEHRGKTKHPFFIHMKHGRMFALAGLWEHWESPYDDVIASFTILTTESNELIKPLHDRMPVIIAPENYGLWLNSEITTPADLAPLYLPFASDLMERWPVSSYVDKPQNEGPQCIAKQGN